MIVERRVKLRYTGDDEYTADEYFAVSKILSRGGFDGCLDIGSGLTNKEVLKKRDKKRILLSCRNVPRSKKK